MFRQRDRHEYNKRGSRMESARMRNAVTVYLPNLFHLYHNVYSSTVKCVVGKGIGLPLDGGNDRNVCQTVLQASAVSSVKTINLSVLRLCARMQPSSGYNLELTDTGGCWFSLRLVALRVKCSS